MENNVKAKKPIYKRWYFWFAITFVVGVIFAVLVSDEPEPPADVPPSIESNANGAIETDGGETAYNLLLDYDVSAVSEHQGLVVIPRDIFLSASPADMIEFIESGLVEPGFTWLMVDFGYMGIHIRRGMAGHSITYGQLLADKSGLMDYTIEQIMINLIEREGEMAYVIFDDDNNMIFFSDLTEIIQ